jgi:hypothetical protein
MKNAQNVNSDNIPKVNLLKDVVPIRQCAKGISYYPKKSVEPISKCVDPQFSRLPNQHVVVMDECTILIQRIKALLASMNEPNTNKQTKIITATGIYSLLNSEMMKHVKLYGSNRFVLTVFNQTFELENQINDINLSEGIDIKIIENFRTEIIKIRPTLKVLIEKIEDNVIWQSTLDVARNNLNKVQRPRRNIPRVNYSWMDMNLDDFGEICVFKPWFEDGKIIEKCFRRPLSQANELDDEDYIFEEEDAKEKICKKIWTKVHPETAPIKMRTRKQVNYAGMDMNSEDEGEICVFKPWFQDGKVIEKCFRRPLSKANELDDEDYVPEEY